MPTVASLSAVIARMLPEPHAGLLIGLLFGSKASLSADFYDALIITGTIHIIALSGMNITIIMDMVAKSLQGLVGKRWASVISIGVIVWFVVFVGPSATIVRAAIMGSLSLIAIIFGRQYWALFSWIIAVVGMTLIHPAWFGEISFQLSALATLGIILFAKKEQGSIGGLWAFIKTELHLTLSAQVFTIPLILFHFHRISLIAPLANIAIGWVIAPLTVLGWIAAICGSVFLPLGMLFSWIAWVLLEYMIRVVWVASTIPGASVGW
jgi:competence protein ComEC